MIKIKNWGKPWSEDEEDFLKKHRHDMTSREIGEALGRSKTAVARRANKLGLTKGFGR